MPAKAPVKAVSKTKSSGSTKRKVTSALAIKKSPAAKKVTTAKKAATAKKPAAAKKKTVAKSRAKIVATKPLKSFSIVETSPANWSQTTNRPSFEQIRLAAYHRWLQSGGHEGDNWLSAEQDLSSDELVEAVTEMAQRVEGTFVETPEQKEMQAKLKHVLSTHPKLQPTPNYYPIRAEFASCFLSRYPNFLD